MFPTLFTDVLPYFEFYEGKDGTQDKLCRVYFTKAMRVNKDKMRKTYDCDNDEAKSIKICNAKKGTKIAVFDDPNYRASKDDWSEVTVTKDMGNKCSTIKEFEFSGYSADDGILKIDYKTTGNLNGKVSSFTIMPGKN